MYEKVCKWCNELISVNKQVLFASHVATCKMNPNLEERYKRNSIKGVLKVDRIEIEKECLKCKEIFSVITTESEIKNKRVKSFCSRKCANSRKHSDETKVKIGKSLIEGGKRFSPIASVKEIIKFTCIKCGKEGIDNRYNRNRKYHIDCWTSISGGIKKGSSRGKSGWYKGYWCDSSYELAYLIYNLDNSTEVERNKKGFNY